MKARIPLFAAASLTAAAVLPMLTSCMVDARRPPVQTTVIETQRVPGYYVTTLPRGYTTVTRGGIRYYVVDGIYHRPRGSGYVVVQRPF
jgi:hypothetical protein